MSTVRSRHEADGQQERTAPPRKGAVWPGLVPLGILAVAVLILGSAARALLGSPLGLLVAVGVVAAFVGLSALLRGRVPDAARAVLLSVPALALAAWLVVPTLRDTVSDEPLAGGASLADLAAAVPTEPAEAAAGDETSAGSRPAAAEEEAPDGDAAPSARPSPTVAAQGVPPSRAAQPAAPSPAPAPAPAQPAEPPTPTVLGSGTLVGIDHSATGMAGLVSQADGSLLVRLEDIDVENGPDYVLYLVPGGAATTPDGGADLGPLTANVGSSNYAVPPGTPGDGPQTVLIWCRPFAVPIAHAPLS